MTTDDRAATSRSRARRGDGERLREEILAAVENMLLAGADEQSLSIRALATAVGVTPPAIYRHFEDKDELLLEVCERRFAAFDAEVEGAGQAADTALDALRARARAYVRFGREHPEYYRILFLKKATGVLGQRAAQRGGAGFTAFSHLVAAVQACMDSGQLRREDPVRVAVCVWAALHGLTALLISLPHFPWPEVESLVELVLDVQLTGLGAPDVEA